MPSFSETLADTLHRALNAASIRRHEYATNEHLLLALIDDANCSELMRACAVDLEALRRRTVYYLDKELERLPESAGDIDPSPTAAFQRVVQRAILHIQASGRDEVTGANVLVALFSERETPAVHFLQEQDMSRLDAVSFISHGVGKGLPPMPPPQPEPEPEPDFDRDFFISYAKEDEPVARDINQVLTSAGFTTVTQFQDFLPSANFVREMQKALTRSARMIVLHSPHYERSDHCQAEWAAGYNEDPGGERGKIVPFLVAPTELNPLARQVIYTSLVGLDLPARHVAILRAVSHIAALRSRKESAREAARVASPDVQLKGRLLDAVPNAALDRPVPASGLSDLPPQLRALSGAIVDSLPANAPPVVTSCLTRYATHLAERGEQPIMGLLITLVAAVEREYRSVECELWGPGLDDLIGSFLAKHGLFVSHFPKIEDRERFFAETPIEEDQAVGEKLERPVREASKALDAMSAEGLTTPAFDSVVAGQQRQAEDLARVMPADEQLANVITAKRRFVLGSIGFYERVLSVLANAAKLLDSSSVQAAITVLQKSIESLVHLIR